ncbi:hypothetical protein OH76DRAFT_195173 [Lentinus brumalis]|uniref:Uncharacterized protein n=1 Tax=Lentinus brumalis TaxID=2498619 RepID=A0A371DI05_9APHY|nr:hypothetical protein OH76DRAFT_195173 [Polyporus brumalis]
MGFLRYVTVGLRACWKFGFRLVEYSTWSHMSSASVVSAMRSPWSSEGVAISTAKRNGMRPVCTPVRLARIGRWRPEG